MNTYNNFELLLLAASEEYCRQQTELFLNMDATDFQITPQHRKRFEKILRKNHHKRLTPWGVIKIAAVACLLCLSIAFTACVCIPKVRKAIKEVFFEWYDEYVAIGFEEPTGEEAAHSPNPSETSATDNDVAVKTPLDAADQDDNDAKPSGTVKPEPPKEILKKAYATYLPNDNYRMEIDIDNIYYYAISYYNNSDLIFSLAQNIISTDLHWTDSETQTLHRIKINEMEAVCLEETETPNCYSIIWQDDDYEYIIMGIFSDLNEAIKIAEGIRLQ